MSTKRECPSCRTVYAGEDKVFCPRDGTRLLDKQAVRPPEDPFLGRVVAGRFVLERRLGKGGMGVVYLARHNVFSRQFAVKLLLREFVSNERALARFFREARVASSVDHPNIVSIYDYGQTDKGEPYLVMEYVDGTLLYHLVHKSPTRNLYPAYAVHIALQVARALEHAHARGVVHRDIKPENILLTTWNGESDWVKVLDFGVARVVGQPPLTRIGEELIGTPEFMAPEAMESVDVNPPVDLYALGIMLHDLIVGEAPFRGDIRSILYGHLNTVPPLLSERRPGAELPLALDRLVAQLLAKNPAERPTAAQTVAELLRVQSQMPTRAAHSSQDALGRRDSGDSIRISGSGLQITGAPTMILDGRELGGAGSSDSGPATMVLPSSIASGLSASPAVGLSPARPSQPVVVGSGADPSKRAEIEALESELDIASLRLSQLAHKLAAALWPGDWPAAATALRQKIADTQAAEEGCGQKLLAVQARSVQGSQLLDEQRQALRHRILSLSERTQLDKGLSVAEREQLQRSIEESERSLARLEPTPISSVESELHTLRRQLRELQQESRHGWSELGRLLLRSAAAPSSLSADLVQAQQQIDAAQSMLSLLRRTPR